jgi:3-oxoacyl-[acyl-carrier protein] reductase
MNQKTAIVTGASRGIGAATTKLLAKSGYNVVVCYHKNEALAEGVASDIRENGGEASVFGGDFAAPGEACRLAQFAVKQYGHIDLLVNNAGVTHRALLGDMTDDQIKSLIDIDLLGLILLSREATREMVRKKSGAVVNISSIHGISGASMESVYSAAKAGIIGFTKALAKELAPCGITVNCVAPGVIDTGMNDFLSDEEQLGLEDEIPLGRFGTAEEVAKCVLFLAEHPYITGQVLAADGGYTI